MGEDVAERLERALSAESRDIALGALGSAEPASVLEAIRIRWSAHGGDRARILRLLDEIGADETVLLDLLEDADGDAAAELLRRLVRRCSSVPTGTLRRLLDGTSDDGGPALLRLTIEAVGLTRDPALIGVIHGHLCDPAVRSAAALALGRLGAIGYAVEIADLLPQIDNAYDHGTAVVALELMGDPDVVPILRRWLADAPDSHVHELHEALNTLSGRAPTTFSSPEEIRAHWRAL